VLVTRHRESRRLGYVMVTLTFANGALGAIDNSRKAVYGTINVWRCSVPKA